jgi:hypothetical protein
MPQDATRVPPHDTAQRAVVKKIMNEKDRIGGMSEDKYPGTR